MVSFPANLPFCPADGSFEAAIIETRVATPSDMGPQSFRRRYSGLFEQVSFDVIYTAAQFADLLSFFSDECKGGALNFTAASLGGGIALSEYTWSAPPTRRPHIPSMGKFRVTFSLVRRVS